MVKNLFIEDYEIHASAKMLFPYISTASGLSEWFADDVSISPEKVYTFEWDNEQRKAVIASHRTNHFIKFDFIPDNEEDEKDLSYFELRIELNELTQTTFLKVTDYSAFDDPEELRDLWNSLVDQLRSVVGG
ncbi:MAG: ATPase [Cyclobacteriaceae bacterium]|nr:ATPase [Cyclobacteriaceae bacterium]